MTATTRATRATIWLPTTERTHIDASTITRIRPIDGLAECFAWTRDGGKHVVLLHPQQVADHILAANRRRP